jgi:hypothetical protein
LASYFGWLQYKLMDRYLITGTVRRDGSSNFGKDYRWGILPAFGLDGLQRGLWQMQLESSILKFK